MDLVKTITAILEDDVVRERAQRVLNGKRRRLMGIVHRSDGRIVSELLDKKVRAGEISGLPGSIFHHDEFHPKFPIRRLYELLSHEDLVNPMIFPYMKREWYWGAGGDIGERMFWNTADVFIKALKGFDPKGEALVLVADWSPHPAFKLAPELRGRPSFSEITRKLYLTPPAYATLNRLAHEEISHPRYKLTQGQTTYAFLRAMRSHPESDNDMSFVLVSQKEPFPFNLEPHVVMKDLRWSGTVGSPIKSAPIPIPEPYTTLRGFYNPTEKLVSIHRSDSRDDLM